MVSVKMWENLYLRMMDLRNNFEALQNQWEKIGAQSFYYKRYWVRMGLIKPFNHFVEKWTNIL